LLFGYGTSIAWETFAVSVVTNFIREVGVQVGVMFLALAGLEAALPHALSLFTREARARFGRSAAVSALTALSIGAIALVVQQFVAHAFPSSASVALLAPSEVATPLPAVIETLQALFGAIVIAAAVALYATAIRKHAAIVTIVAIFCLSIDPSATAAQTPLMLLRALLAALLAWVVARYVLDGNPLAWPLAAFLVSILQVAGVLLQNHRPDLIGNGIALLVIGIATLAWVAAPRMTEVRS
jgi:hypothetical protein